VAHDCQLPRHRRPRNWPCLSDPHLAITRSRSDTTSDRAWLFGEVFVVTAAALVLTRFAVIPLLRWLDVTLF